MIRCILILLSLFRIFFFTDTIHAEQGRTYLLPMATTRQLVTEWLTNHDKSWQVISESGGLIRYQSATPEEHWSLALLPHSPLATVVTVHDTDKNGSKEISGELFEYLNIKSAPHSEALELQQPEFPQAVLERISTVACLQAGDEEQTLQFSGVFIDEQGGILCTAHDLREHEKVNIFSTIGTSFEGDIIKIDFDRDLALIKINAKPEQVISPETGRNLLGMGEKIFSIGCPVNLRGTVSSGFINGPPRRVNNQPLWQASIDVQPGSSGSPVFDSNGKLVALIKARHRASPGIGFLIPLEVIIDFLNEQNQQ